MQPSLVTDSDGVLRSEPPPMSGSGSLFSSHVSLQRMVLLAIIQRMTSEVATESLIAETVHWLQKRLGLLDVTISLANSTVPTAGFPSSFGSASSFFALSVGRSRESWVEVPVLLNNIAIGSVRCRMSMNSDSSSNDIESYLVLVAALLACHVRMSQASGIGSLPGETVKLPDKTWAIQRTMIVQALKQTKGNMAAAARDLGITPRIIRYKVRKLGIDPHQVA